MPCTIPYILLDMAQTSLAPKGKMETTKPKLIIYLMNELFEFAKEVGNLAANNLFYIKKKVLPHKIKSKEDSSPLYNFDLLMDEFISSKLIKTGFQVISEESYKKGQILNREYWIVDPIDGSKEINSKKGKMTITPCNCHFTPCGSARPPTVSGIYGTLATFFHF